MAEQVVRLSAVELTEIVTALRSAASRYQQRAEYHQSVYHPGNSSTWQEWSDRCSSLAQLIASATDVHATVGSTSEITEKDYQHSYYPQERGLPQDEPPF